MIRTVVIASAIVVGSMTPAWTQIQGGAPFSDGTRPTRGAVYGTPVDALPTPFSQGGSCVQMCIADTTPCDPDYYKIADRRCNVNQNGIFPK